MLAKWKKWKTAFPQILDMGDGLLPTGRRLSDQTISDGPSVESKEIISGYSIVGADNYDEAVVVAQACPISFMLGSVIETDGGHTLASSYHLEAAIAAEHAFAKTFADTRWEVIVTLYDHLTEHDPSPLHALHAAIAASHAHGPEAGLARLSALSPPTWLSGSHLWLATHADMHARAGRASFALDLYDKAIAFAPHSSARS